MTTIVEQMETRYRSAIAEIDRTIAAGPQTAQQRYDYKKLMRRNGGRPPKKYTTGLERLKHELSVQLRWELKGVQEAKDYLQTHEELGLDPDWVEEVFGDVQAAIDRTAALLASSED